MNTKFTRDFLTGLTALAGIAGLFFMLILFGELTPLAERNYDFRVALANAGGLDDASPVRLNGVKVGQVTKAMVSDKPGNGAVVSVRVRRGISIPRTAKISVDKGLVGGTSLDFSTSAIDAKSPGDFVQEGETVEGGDPGSFLGGLQDAVKGPLAKLEATAANIDKLAAEYTELGKHLNDLVEPRTLADVAAGKAANLRSTLSRMDKALAGADAWLTDTTLRTRVNDLFTKAESVMADAHDLTQTWTATGKSVDETVQSAGAEVKQFQIKASEVATQAKAALDRVQSAGDQLSAMVENVNKGRGTLGQLITNPDLYRSLDDAAAKLSRALEEAQLLIEKYKAEGIKLKL